MTTRDKFTLCDGQFWCRWHGYRMRVTLDRCHVCVGRGVCTDYQREMGKLGFCLEDLQEQEPPTEE